MGRDCASERVPIALAEAEQRTPARAADVRQTRPDASKRARWGGGEVKPGNAALFPSRPSMKPADASLSGAKFDR
jgi:hypothetical protein